MSEAIGKAPIHPVGIEGDMTSRSSPFWKRAVRSKAVQLFVAFGALNLIAYYQLTSLGGIGADGFVERFGVAAPLVSGSILMVITLAPTTMSEILAIAQGTLYGFWTGLMVIWISWVLASMVEYAIARFGRVEFRLADYSPKLPRWLQRFPVSHPGFLIPARWIPWGGGHLVNLAAGVGGVSWWRQLWCAALSNLPISLLWAALGSGLLYL